MPSRSVPLGRARDPGSGGTARPPHGARGTRRRSAGAWPSRGPAARAPSAPRAPPGSFTASGAPATLLPHEPPHHRPRPRPRDPRLPRQPHGRGRGPPLDGRGGPAAGPERRAAPAPTRPSSCATAGARYGGKGVQKAVAHVVGRARGRSPSAATRSTSPGSTPRCGRRTGPRTSAGSGANAVLAVSLAAAHAAAAGVGQPLYRFLGERFGAKEWRLPVPDAERAQRRGARGQRPRRAGGHGRARRRCRRSRRASGPAPRSTRR